jgi:hypothetical protein
VSAHQSGFTVRRLGFQSLNMRRMIHSLFAKLDSYRHKRKVSRALDLYLRGEVRRDGLQLTSMRSSLEIEWRARDVHPWDRDSRRDERRAMLVSQTLFDTDAAIARLFDSLPYVDVLQIRVLGVGSDTSILGGTVTRSSLEEVRDGLSVRMKLRELGITYHSEGLQFEPLPVNGLVYDRPWTVALPEMTTIYRNTQL